MLRRTFVHSITLLFALVAIACGPSGGSGDDDDDTGDGGTDPCTGNATRCVGTQYQTCRNGVYQTEENCPNACDATRGGCLDCVPPANACMGDNVVTCNADGTFGSTVMTCAAGTECSGGTCNRACSADGVDVIYVVDDGNRLLSFDPRLIGSAGGPYQMIGMLSCPNPGTSLQPGGGAATPFSMAIDREAGAWILFSSGRLFRASTDDAACMGTTFMTSQVTPMQTWNLFGMGFVTDAAGGDAEKLWIGGGNVDATSAGSLGWIDTTSLAITRVSPVGVSAENSAEFTGLGDATLWAFFPNTQANAFVQQLDKTTGAGVGNRLMFDLAAPGRSVRAWAFAQWGGKFYVFVTTVNGITGGSPSSAVHEVDRATGAHRIVPITTQQYIVVGAGVSTCAPVVIGGPPAGAHPSASDGTGSIAR